MTYRSEDAHRRAEITRLRILTTAAIEAALTIRTALRRKDMVRLYEATNDLVATLFELQLIVRALDPPD